MPPARPVWPSVCLSAMLLIAGGTSAARAETAEVRHALWRDCLSRNFAIQAALTERDLAADAAFQACRTVEDAYLAALADSPLLDDDDLARARPLLAGRIRTWLVGTRR